MRSVALALICVSAWAAESAYDIVRRSCERDSENLALREKYTYRHTDQVRHLDKRGRVEKTEVTVREVIWIGGAPYTRVVEKDGKRLSAEEIDRSTPKPKRDAGERRRKMLERERQLRMQIPDAYTFTLVGDERVNGRDCYRIAAEPKPGFKPRTRQAGVLTKLRGTLWIDKADYELARVDAESLDTISFGLALLRIGKGARLEMEQALVNGELWAPTMLRVTAHAKALLLLGTRFDTLIRFHDYRKYSVESVVTPELAITR